MAEMIGLSRDLQRPSGVIGGLLAVLPWPWLRRRWAHREPRLRMEEWPDYLLRDIGLERSDGRGTDPRSLPTDWLVR